MSAALRFSCPSCGAKLAPVGAMDSATQVVTRTCRSCGERWQLIVRAVKVTAAARFDAATLTFLGRRARRPS